MGLDSNKLKGLRTFQRDKQNLHSNNLTTPVSEPEVVAAPKTSFPPVLSPKRPDPVISAPTITPAPNEQSQKELDTKRQTVLDTSATSSSADKNPAAEQAPFLTPVKDNHLETAIHSEMEIIGKRIPKIAEDRLSVMDNDSEITEGSIITDQKRDRFKLLPAIIESLKSWFISEKEAIEDKAEAKRKAVPTVRSLENRREIIEKASKQSAIAPKDDYKKLTSQIPAANTETTEPKSGLLLIKKKSAKSEPNWSHFEEGVPKTSVVEPIIATPVQIDPVVKAEEKSIIPTPQPIPVPTITPKPPVPPTPQPKSEPQPTPIKTEPVRINISAKQKPLTTPSYQKSPRQSVPKKRLWILATGVAIAIVAVGSGVTATFWFFQNSSSTQFASGRPADKTIQVPVNYGDIKYISIPAKRSELYSLLLDETKNPSASLNLVIPTIDEADKSTPASTSQIMSLLNWQLNNTFIRSINEIYFGSFKSEPVIILKVSSFDNAFGGILSSEKELGTELSPLFGEVVTGTFVINSQTESNVVAPHFVDETAKNHDVRVLKDELEKERIVYGFVNRNTIIITTNKDTFATVADKIK